MIIRGVNAAVTRENGATVLNIHELLDLLPRRERLGLIRIIEAYNEEEKRAGMAPRPRQSLAILRVRDKWP